MNLLLEIGFLIGVFLLNLITGRSIFFWVARGCITIDAACLCTSRILKRSCEMWRDRIAETIGEVRRDVAGMCVETEGGE